MNKLEITTIITVLALSLSSLILSSQANKKANLALSKIETIENNFVIGVYNSLLEIQKQQQTTNE